MSDQHSNVSDEEIMEVFYRSNDAFLTAAEIAERLGFSRQAANHRLKQLEDEGLLRRKSAGSRAVGWWKTED